MHILGTVLNVFFIIICILLILLILLQSGRSSGMSLFGGSASQTAFGASSGDVLTKTTAILVALFMLSGIGMAFIKKQDSSLQRVQQKMTENPGMQTEDEKSDPTVPSEPMNQDNVATPAEGTPNNTTENSK